MDGERGKGSILQTDAISRTLGEPDIPLFQLLSLLAEPSLWDELLRSFEQFGIAVNRIDAHGNNCLPYPN